MLFLKRTPVDDAANPGVLAPDERDTITDR
jgi:hypothetical protein